MITATSIVLSAMRWFCVNFFLGITPYIYQEKAEPPLQGQKISLFAANVTLSLNHLGETSIMDNKQKSLDDFFKELEILLQQIFERVAYLQALEGIITDLEKPKLH